MNIETFKKRFDFPDDILSILLDGNTSYLMIQDKNDILCRITFDKNNLPVVTEQDYWADVSGNENHLYPGVSVKGSVIRRCYDSVEINNKIYNWLKKIFKIG